VCSGRHLVLIHVVLISDASSDACALALLRAGAKSVDFLMFAQVVDAIRAPI
jgi:predicted amidophosphoribosyltransferase